jgi:hypothetical protein
VKCPRHDDFEGGREGRRVGGRKGGRVRVRVGAGHLRRHVAEVIEEVVGGLDVGQGIIQREDGAVGLHQAKPLGRLRLDH